MGVAGGQSCLKSKGDGRTAMGQSQEGTCMPKESYSLN